MKTCAGLSMLGSLLLVAACMGEPTRDVKVGYGPDPLLPEPDSNLIPTVNVADATGWANGEMPEAAAGLEVMPPG